MKTEFNAIIEPKIKTGCTHQVDRQALSAMKRRNFLVMLGVPAIPMVGIGIARAAHKESGPISQPEVPSDQSFMKRAIAMRDAAVGKGDQPFGAVIVRKGVIIGQSWSRVNLDRDPTAHAEMAAIRDAAHRVGDKDLSGSVMYSSSRPCPMCEAAAYWAGITRMVHGHQLNKAGAPKLCN